MGYDPQDKGEEWIPIHLCDLQTAGVGKDAPKDLRADQSGPGKEMDQRMERMYAAARRSWNLLNTKIPGRGGALKRGGGRLQRDVRACAFDSHHH